MIFNSAFKGLTVPSPLSSFHAAAKTWSKIPLGWRSRRWIKRLL